MRALRAIVVVLLISLGFLGGYFAGWFLHGENQPLSSLGSSSNAPEEAADLQRRILEELQNRYYKKIDVGALAQAGVTGTLEALDDPYTVYLTPAELQTLREKQKGEYSGIGAALEADDAGIVITNVFDGSPAKEAGLQPGDTITAVDGEPTAGEAIESSIARIKGDEGTQVELTIKPKGDSATKPVTLTRRTIVYPETRTEIVSAGKKKVGYIQLYGFGGNAAREVRKDVESLSAKGAQAFILDLRYNGGGLLGQAVDVTGIFQTGVVTSTKGLNSPLNVLETQGPVETTKPLVILINNYSASASEIVTGALRDSDRAEVIGTKTFGKGLVQSIVDLGNGDALKLTTAMYLTPKGTDINEKGIAPDVRVEDDLKTKADEQMQRALKYLASAQ